MQNKAIADALITIQKLEEIKAKLKDSLSQQTTLKNDTAITDLKNNIGDVNTLIESIKNLQQDVQDAIQSKRRVFPDDLENLRSETNRGNTFFDTLSRDLLSNDKSNPQSSRYIAAGEVVLRELQKLEDKSPNKKPTLSLNIQCENIQNNEFLKDQSKVFLINLMREVFNGKETMTSSEFKENLIKVVFEKSNHIIGFEMAVDSQRDEKSQATEISVNPKSIVPAAFVKTVDSENRSESEASEVSKDSMDDKKSDESGDDSSYYI